MNGCDLFIPTNAGLNGGVGMNIPHVEISSISRSKKMAPPCDSVLFICSINFKCKKYNCKQ